MNKPRLCAVLSCNAPPSTTSLPCKGLGKNGKEATHLIKNVVTGRTWPCCKECLHKFEGILEIEPL